MERGLAGTVRVAMFRRLRGGIRLESRRATGLVRGGIGSWVHAESPFWGGRRPPGDCAQKPGIAPSAGTALASSGAGRGALRGGRGAAGGGRTATRRPSCRRWGRLQRRGARSHQAGLDVLHGRHRLGKGGIDSDLGRELIAGLHKGLKRQKLSSTHLPALVVVVR